MVEQWGEVECAELQAREIIDGEDVVEEGFYTRDIE